ATNVSGWVRRSTRPDDVAADAADAVVAALGPPGQVATLILPADVSWGDGARPAPPRPAAAVAAVADDVVDAVAKALVSGEPCVLLLGGRAVREDGLLAASRVAAATGARLLCETFPARLERGARLPSVDRLGHPAEVTVAQLGGPRH